MEKKEETLPVVGFRQCPICKAEVHWECPGGEIVELPKSKKKGMYLCNCGCEAAS